MQKKALIIDDEKLARDIVKNYLHKFPEIEIVGECSNGFDALKLINELSPDLVFLDIQMPKLTGFELLELIENPPVIIFTTAFDQYALKAFEVNATDYLLKPFSEERFADAISKSFAKLSNKEENSRKIEELIKLTNKQNGYLERVVVKSGQKINVISVDNLKYIEAQDDYTMLYTEKGNFLKQKTMRYFEENLNPSEFIRIHRSYIIRISQIKQIDLFEKESYFVTLSDGKKLPVSKSGYQKLKDILNQ